MWKPFFLLIFLHSIISPSFSQTVQIGKVREINSNRQPVAGVQIIFEDAVPTNSDNVGNFRLVFDGKEAGELVFLEEIRKQGYELVNHKDFEILKLSNTNELGEDIILAKQGVIDLAKKEYYGISDQALFISYSKEKDALRDQLKESKLNEEEYLNQLRVLQDQYDRQKESLDALAEKFSRINFDDVEELYREALELFKAGEVEACKEKLEGANLIERTNLRLQERERITNAESSIAQQKDTNEKGIQEDIQLIQLQTQTYLLSFEFEKAEALYDQLVLLDSSNLEILLEVADFYAGQLKYEKAIHSYSKLILHPGIEEWQMAEAYLSLARLYVDIGNIELALENLNISLEKNEVLVSENPESVKYKINLGKTYSGLYYISNALGNAEEAHRLAKRNNDIYRKTYEANPQNVEVKRRLSSSYQRLGLSSMAMNKKARGISCFEESIRLSKELFELDTTETSNKYLLAEAYGYLGYFYTNLAELESSFTYIQKEIRLLEKLSADLPHDITYKRELAFSYYLMGTLYRDKEVLDSLMGTDDLDTAIVFFEKSIILCGQLYEAHPQNIGFKNLLGFGYAQIGSIHSSRGMFNESEPYFEKSQQYSIELTEISPRDVNLNYSLADIYFEQGENHNYGGEYNKALPFYKNYHELIQNFSNAFPNDLYYKSDLGISYKKLGFTYLRTGHPNKALQAFQDGLEIFEMLAEKDPAYIIDYKQHIAQINVDLGRLHFEDFQDKEKSLRYYEKAERLYLYLSKNDPNDYLSESYLNEISFSILSQSLPEETIEVIYYLKEDISYEKDTLKRYQLNASLCDTLRKYYLTAPRLKTDFAAALNDQAWYGFFLKKFSASEAAIREAMALNTGNEYLATNLAPALLLQGKFSEAKREYRKWKDQPFQETTYKEVFLDDLATFEKAEIIPIARQADVEAIRKTLRK